MLQTQWMSGITAATRRKWKQSNTFMFFIKIQSWSISKLFWIHGKKCLGTIESIQYTIWENKVK